MNGSSMTGYEKPPRRIVNWPATFAVKLKNQFDPRIASLFQRSAARLSGTRCAIVKSVARQFLEETNEHEVTMTSRRYVQCSHFTCLCKNIPSVYPIFRSPSPPNPRTFITLVFHLRVPISDLRLNHHAWTSPSLRQSTRLRQQAPLFSSWCARRWLPR